MHKKNVTRKGLPEFRKKEKTNPKTAIAIVA
jgi:hypothetical protein